MQDQYLKKLMLVEVDEMVEPTQRYMSMNVDNNMIQELIDIYEDDGRIDRTTVARTIGRSMNLSDRCTTPSLGRKPERLNLRRFRFFLHVVEREATRNDPGKSFLITGFTDEIGDEDLIDLNEYAALYINSIVELRSFEERDRRGDRYERFSISKMAVVHRKDYERRGHHNGRVTDILNFCSLNETNELNLSNPDPDNDVMATSTLFGKRATRGASLSDMTRNNFLTRLITADKSGMADSKTYSDNEYGNDDEGFGCRRYNMAASTYADTPEFDRGNTFITWLRSRNLNVSDELKFEYRDLIDMVETRSPSYDDLCEDTDIVAIEDNDITYVSKEFYGKSAKMRSLAIMCQEIPAMMAECLLSRISFTMDNERLDRDGRPQSSPDDYSMVVPLEGLDEMVDVFLRRFEDEIYNQVTNNNDRYMNLRVTCNFGGQVEIEMSYENGDFEEFRFPSFMSGLLSDNASYDSGESYRLANQYTQISKDFIERTVFGENDDRTGDIDEDRRSRMSRAFLD